MVLRELQATAENGNDELLRIPIVDGPSQNGLLDETKKDFSFVVNAGTSNQKIYVMLEDGKSINGNKWEFTKGKFRLATSDIWGPLQRIGFETAKRTGDLALSREQYELFPNCGHLAVKGTRICPACGMERFEV